MHSLILNHIINASTSGSIHGSIYISSNSPMKNPYDDTKRHALYNEQMCDLAETCYILYYVEAVSHYNTILTREYNITL